MEDKNAPDKKDESAPDEEMQVRQNARRREFLKNAAIFAAGAIGQDIVQRFWDSTVDALVRPIDELLSAHVKTLVGFKPNDEISVQKSSGDESNKLLLKLIGFKAHRLIKLSGGHDHYLFPNEMHPDNELALNAMLNALGGDPLHYETDVNRGDFSPSGSFICFGGPISNLRTASFLGYERINPQQPRLGFRPARNVPFRLGINFEVNAEDLRKRGLVMKTSIQGDPTPEWGIRIGDRFLYTKAGEDDYLLVSRLPNWISPRAGYLAAPDTIVIFAGCHGAGMGSVRLLVQSAELLERLDYLTKRYRFWQALIRVEVIKRVMHPITHSLRDEATAVGHDLVAHFPIYV